MFEPECQSCHIKIVEGMDLTWMRNYTTKEIKPYCNPCADMEVERVIKRGGSVKLEKECCRNCGSEAKPETH